jgi:3-oxoacyl-[acyl-carrier protein] reductase
MSTASSLAARGLIGHSVMVEDLPRSAPPDARLCHDEPMTSAALITGVGRQRGIGASIAAGLADDGWDLALSFWRPYDDREGLERGPADPEGLASQLRRSGRSVELVPADLEDPRSPATLVRRAVESVGPLEALVLSHCEGAVSGFSDTTVESFDRHYAVNVRASWLLIQAFARQLPAGGGSVVALTSDHTVGNLPYGASKAALDRVVLAAGHELGHLGLRANAINPGPVDTGWMDEQTRAHLTALQPTGRLGTPTDAANLVRFLVSEPGRWVNGQLLHSNGGFPSGQLPV